LIPYINNCPVYIYKEQDGNDTTDVGESVTNSVVMFSIMISEKMAPLELTCPYVKTCGDVALELALV